VKVASGGLDESFLWENVASERVIRRVERSMKRFGTEGDGGVLGEGGEFETLVIDGPSSLFKGRIEIQEKDQKIVRGGGGSAWLSILNASVVMKSQDAEVRKTCRVPDLLERRFTDCLDILNESNNSAIQPVLPGQDAWSTPLISLKFQKDEGTANYWTVTGNGMKSQGSVDEEAKSVVEDIKRRLAHASLDACDIVSTVIILRSMQDFMTVNKIYGALFTKPNPPARVTISCGDEIPHNINLIIHLRIHRQDPSSLPRKALHVQSRSYWAPANIGPYSQAVSIPLPTSEEADSHIWTVAVAGQIPLIPHTMTLPSPESTNPLNAFKLQAMLALQHLWRIGQDTHVKWWTSAVAYVPRSADASTTAVRATIAAKAWTQLHQHPVDSDTDNSSEERDLWEEKHHAGMQLRGGNTSVSTRNEQNFTLPDWSIVELSSERRDEFSNAIPPCFTAEVDELPRQSAIEWHAHLGVVLGPVKIISRSQTNEWAIHQCVFGTQVQTLLMIEYTLDGSVFRRRVDGALGEVGVVAAAEQQRAYLSYVDVSVQGEGDVLGLGCEGMVPCRSLWDMCGRRIAAVLLFSTSASV